MQPRWRGFQGGWARTAEWLSCAAVTGCSGAGAGRVWGRTGLAPGGSLLPLDRRAFVEAELGGGGLGLGGSQRWGAGWKTEATQDGADGFFGLDGGEQTHTGSTVRAGEGVHGKHTLE